MTHRIPFGKNVRVTAMRGVDGEGDPPFWWIIRGVDNLPIELAGVRLPGSARLRLHKLVSYKAKPLEEIDIYSGRNSGALYLVTIAGQSTNFAFLEGCIRAYIGQSAPPLFLSSGMEDYFLGTYYFNRGKYYTSVGGLTHLIPGKEFSGYRFHDADPIFFTDGLRLTIRAGEQIDGNVFGPKPGPAETTFTTYVWAYEW